jgi:uncharacterized LabA/DUF88 family protein
VQVHLAADGDDGVCVGVLVYADLEVRADPLLSKAASKRPTDINPSAPQGKPPFRGRDGYFSATMRAMEGRDQSSRVAVFVDGANLYHAIKSYYRGVLDYSRLLEAAVGDRRLLRATFYIVEKQEADDPQSTPSARSFVYNLNKFGYKVRSKPLQVHETVTPDGERAVSHKGDWDVGIVVDMMRLAAHADAYVLVSGDGDYVEAIEYLQSEKGLRVEVISAAQCTSQALLDACDLHTDLATYQSCFDVHRNKPSALSNQAIS